MYGRNKIYNPGCCSDREKNKENPHRKGVQRKEPSGNAEPLMSPACLPVDERAGPAVNRQPLHDAQDIGDTYGRDACGKG